MRVLVTGAAGFVGGHLLPRLAAQGHEAIAVDREVEIGDASAVATAVREAAPDALIHLAGLSSVALSRERPLATWRTNYVGSRNVLEAVRRVRPNCHVVLVGSGEIYGRADPDAEPFDEQRALAPGSPYAASKASADRLGAAYGALGLRVARMRPFNHTGPGQSAHFVAGSFARQAAEIATGKHSRQLRVGNLESVRDFLDVDDVVGAYLAVIDAGATGAFNVSSGRGRRIAELLDGLLVVAGIEVEIVIDPSRLRATDASVGSSARLRESTGWAPQVPFERTLARMFEHALAGAKAG